MADGFGETGVEGEGCERVTSSQTESASAALSIFCKSLVPVAHLIQDTLDHSREQHGLSSGHCSLVLQDGGSSSAHAAVAHNDASSSEESKRTMVINMVYIIYIFSENCNRIEIPKERNQVRGSFTPKLWGLKRGCSRDAANATQMNTVLLYCAVSIDLDIS